jgi:hypothetical protein
LAKNLSGVLIKEIGVQRAERYRWSKKRGKGEQSSRKYAQLMVEALSKPVKSTEVSFKLIKQCYCVAAKSQQSV